MRRALLALVVVVAGAASAGAVDVLLRDGTVVQATSYRLTGSYLLVVLPGGRQVAYDLADVDLDALKAAAAAAAAAAAEKPAAAQPGGMAAAVAAAGAEPGTTISDTDVQHVSSEAEEAPSGPAGPPPGYQEGGQVGLQGMRVSQVEPGIWEAAGEVVNRTDKTVNDVRVQLELHSDVEGLLASADVPVTSVLEPTVKASFSHRFTVATEKTPRVRARVFWMQEAPPEKPPAAARAFGGAAAPAEEGGGARPTPRS